MEDLKRINEELQRELLEASERLRANEYDIMKYKLSNDALHVALWDMDVVSADPVNPNNKFMWSREFRHMLGFTDESDFPNILSSWSDRLHPEDKELTIKALAEHLNDYTGQTPLNVEYRLLMKGGGEYRHFHALGTTMRDGAGAPLRVAGALMDITEKKQTEETLKRRAKLLDALKEMDITLLSQKDKTFDDVIGESLRPITDAVNLDRIDIYRFVDADEGQRLGQVYRWVKSKGRLTSIDDALRVLPHLPAIENWIEAVSEGRCVNIHTGVMSGDEFAFLNPLYVKSLLVTPVFINGELWGAVAFQDFAQERLFDDDSIDFLSSVARLCANAIIKNEMKIELAEAEERIRLMLDSTPLCCQLWDSNFKKIDCNKEAIRLFGFKDKQEYLERYHELYPEYQPDGQRSDDKIAIYLKKTIEEGWCYFDWTYKMLDGTFMPAEAVFVRVSHKGNFAIAGYTRDLREHNKMMNALNDAVNESKKTIDTMSRILNNTDAMIYVTEKDTDKLLFMNEYMKRHFGIESDVVGKHCYEVFHVGINERCDWCPCRKLDIKSDEAVVWEERNSLTNRYYRNTDRYIDWPGGKKAHIQHRVELTDIKQVQDELERNQKMLYTVNNAASLLLNTDIETFDSALFQSMKMMAEAVNVDRVRIWKNHTSDGKLYCTQLYEWSEVVESFHGTEMTINVSYSEKVPGWEEMLSSGNCVNTLVRDMPKESRELISPQGILSLLVVPVFVEDRFWGYVGFDDCHSERKFLKGEEFILRSGSALFANAWLRNEVIVSLHVTSAKLESALEQAELANKAKSDFLSTVSHEIRTPMNVILGITDIQLQTETLEQNIREAFDKIYVSGDLLLGIINDILDLSKIEVGKLDLVINDYDITSLINDTIQLNMMRIGSKPIEFELYIDENTPAVLSGDDLRIKQILNNLLSNAFKYTEAGSVKLSVTPEPYDEDDVNVTLVFRVSDSGPGMTQEQLNMLFDKFTRFTENASRMIEGTGLGMSITRNLLQLMNGEIFIDSEPGKGSVFTVRLPQGKAGSGAIGRKLAESLQQLHINSKAYMKRVQITREPMPYGSVLIVDDVESNIYVARGLLTPYELNIDSANSGVAAIEKINNGIVYDIIFMDHMMPQMDGVEATKIIKSMGYENPIVALTANAVAGRAEFFLKNGFSDFISKPIDIRQLNAVLNKFIRDKQPPEAIEAARLRTSNEKKPIFTNEITSFVDEQVIKAFLSDADKSIAVLDAINKKQRPLDEKDIRMYDIHTHGMKSALANIGKMELSAIASKLEMSVQNGETDINAPETSAFINSLRALIEEFAPNEELENDKTADENPSYLHEQLRIIKAACEGYDEKSVDDAMMKLRERSWSKSTQKLLETIAGYFLHSDFDEIVNTVNKYLDSGI